MKTVEINIYKFNELSEESKERAIEKLYNLEIGGNALLLTIDDAERVGIKMTAFDKVWLIDRASYIHSDFIESSEDVAKLIVKNHGSSCATFQTANNFLKDRQDIRQDIGSKEFFIEYLQSIKELEAKFKKDIQEDYRIILAKNYEYLTSEEAIIKRIKANDYDFTIDGKLYS